MGLSASQARFLQLTARRSNVEYEAQQINFQRLQLATKLEQASTEYQDKTSNRKMVFRYNAGNEIQQIDVTYQNYKNYINQQLEGVSSAQKKYYLVSSSGNKIIVANAEERAAMIASTTGTRTVKKDDGTSEIQQVNNVLDENDFLIADNLDDVDAFQLALQNGDYYFATMDEIEVDESGRPKVKFTTEGWETMGGNAISEDYDKTDDAEAEAAYRAKTDKIQHQDKQLELRLSQLDSERNAIQTEIDSITKVIDDNIEGTFKTFS